MSKKKMIKNKIIIDIIFFCYSYNKIAWFNLRSLFWAFDIVSAKMFGYSSNDLFLKILENKVLPIMLFFIV